MQYYLHTSITGGTSCRISSTQRSCSSSLACSPVAALKPRDSKIHCQVPVALPPDGALGLKGGFALAQSGFTLTIALSLAAALIMAFIVPTLGYAFLKNRVSRFDAAAVAAAYGSVSAVTFVTAMQFLGGAGLQPGGHMAVAMVIMESSAIIMAVLLANSIRHMPASRRRPGHHSAASVPLRCPQLRGTTLARQDPAESFTDGAHLLLLGSMAVKVHQRRAGKTMMQPLLRRPLQGHACLLPPRHGPDGREELP